MELIEREKKLAAEFAVRFVQSDHVVGLGTGSTAAYAVKAIGHQIKSGRLKNIWGVPTSKATGKLAQEVGIRMIPIEDVSEIDVAIDGADEFDPNLNLIKGGGGALLREKIIASFAKEFIVVADSSKRVETLGRFKLPVEVFAFISKPLCYKFMQKGVAPEVRLASDGQKFVSDNGNHIIDLDLGEIVDPAAMKMLLEDMPGVVDHGLFLGYANKVIMAEREDVRIFEK